MRIGSPGDLGPEQILAVARGARLELEDELLGDLARRRESMLAALSAGTPAYGVTTGMGAQGSVALGPEDRAAQSARLMAGRAVGGPPWLEPIEVRALLATRLRTFLSGDAAVSPELCRWLVTLLERDLLPAVPRSGHGSAGEIVPLAHAWEHLAGGGRMLAVDGAGTGAVASGTVVAVDALAGLAPPPLGPKEGVALLQGVPVATALAVLRAAEARTLLGHWRPVVAAELVVVGAPRDPLDPHLGGGDDVLAAELAALRGLAGPEPAPRHLQAPVSFRVVGQVHAHLVRAVDALEDATDRALRGVTDSPAFVEDERGPRFVGGAGFHGLDLAEALEGLTRALTHAAATGSMRLARMLEPRVAALPAQLSPDPGPHAGLVPLHKRVVGELRALPAGGVPLPTETSLGWEDVQTGVTDSAERLRAALRCARTVVAAEAVAVHQATLLDPARLAGAPERLRVALRPVAELLGDDPGDRSRGEDLERLVDLLSRPGPDPSSHG